MFPSLRSPRNIMGNDVSTFTRALRSERKVNARHSPVLDPSPVTQRRGERVPLSPALRDRRGGPKLDYARHGWLRPAQESMG